jgi:thymidylate synthase (FAD)
MGSRLTIPFMEESIGERIPLLDKGFIELVDYMGGDQSVVRSARVSTKADPATPRTEEADERLVRYLMANRHMSPFEQAELVVHMKLPIFVARQMVRHRTAGLNEMSGRYRELPQECYIPEPGQVREQSTSNKQGRAEDSMSPDSVFDFLKAVDIGQQAAFRDYQHFLGNNISREMARINLPLSTYTEWFWKCDLRNLLHFIGLRSDSHAQYEIRVYSDVLLELVKGWVPMTYRAFMDFEMNAFKMSAPLIRYIREGLAKDGFQRGLVDPTPRELQEALERIPELKDFLEPVSPNA